MTAKEKRKAIRNYLRRYNILKTRVDIIGIELDYFDQPGNILAVDGAANREKIEKYLHNLQNERVEVQKIINMIDLAMKNLTDFEKSCVIFKYVYKGRWSEIAEQLKYPRVTCEYAGRTAINKMVALLYPVNTD